MNRKIFGSLLVLLTAGTILIGCGTDTPLGFDDNGAYPTEKLSLESASYLPEVALEAKLLGIHGFEGFANDKRGQGSDDSLNSADSTHQGLGRGQANRLHALINQLDLTDSQAVAIADCFRAYQECADSIVAQYQDERAAAYEAFLAATSEIREMVADSSITSDSARVLLAAAVEEYQAALEPIVAAVRAANEACRADLIACIESNLTAEQLEKWAALMAARPVGDGHPRDTRGPVKDSTGNNGGGRPGDDTTDVDDSTDGDKPGKGKGRR